MRSQNCSSMALEKETNGQAWAELKSFNTFGVAARAERMLVVSSESDLPAVLQANAGPVRVLGGGSNILLTDDVEGLVLKNEIKGKKTVEKDEETVLVQIGGGEDWHEFVLWTLDEGLGGLENLSLIPGTVGAAPIQNIGAYGVEQCEAFERLTAIRLSDGRRDVFDKADCAFGYRDSIFKNGLKGQFLITHVFYRLTTRHHKIRTDYGAIRDRLAGWNIPRPTIRDVSRAVMDIRRRKLPDPNLMGNAGSFFKNPILPAEKVEKLRERFPDIVAYPAEPGFVKVPAGWLIDQCGWKGRRFGPVGCYEKQALVIVNYGGADGAEIWRHACRVMASVRETFGIELQPEVNVW